MSGSEHDELMAKLRGEVAEVKRDEDELVTCRNCRFDDFVPDLSRQPRADGGYESVNVRTFQILREEIKAEKDNYEDEAAVYDPPECPYCGRTTEIGEMGNGRIKYGCYNDDCDIKDEVSEYTYYSKTVSVAPANRAYGRLQSLIDFAHRLALEDRSLHTGSDRSG